MFIDDKIEGKLLEMLAVTCDDVIVKPIHTSLEKSSCDMYRVAYEIRGKIYNFFLPYYLISMEYHVDNVSVEKEDRMVEVSIQITFSKAVTDFINEVRKTVTRIYYNEGGLYE